MMTIVQSNRIEIKFSEFLRFTEFPLFCFLLKYSVVLDILVLYCVTYIDRAV